MGIATMALTEEEMVIMADKFKKTNRTDNASRKVVTVYSNVSFAPDLLLPLIKYVSNVFGWRMWPLWLYESLGGLACDKSSNAIPLFLLHHPDSPLL